LSGATRTRARAKRFCRFSEVFYTAKTGFCHGAAMTEIKNRGGRPRFEATAKRRQKVERMKAADLPEAAIAKELGCSERTLRRLFKTELAHGRNSAIARVAGTVIARAEAGDMAAAALFLKTKGKWSEKINIGLELSEEEMAAYQAFKSTTPEFLGYLVAALRMTDARSGVECGVEFLEMLAPHERRQILQHFSKKEIGHDTAQ